MKRNKLIPFLLQNICRLFLFVIEFTSVIKDGFIIIKYGIQNKKIWFFFCKRQIVELGLLFDEVEKMYITTKMTQLKIV